MEAKLKKWIAATGKVDKHFKRAVKANEEEIIDANTAQLSTGKDSLGEFLDDYLFDSYAKMKKAMGSNAPLGVPDLKLEGDFYEGFVIKYAGSEMWITSTDDKTSHLKEKYGDDIFGIAQEQLPTLSPLILESFLISFNNELL